MISIRDLNLFLKLYVHVKSYPNCNFSIPVIIIIFVQIFLSVEIRQDLQSKHCLFGSQIRLKFREIFLGSKI